MNRTVSDHGEQLLFDLLTGLVSFQPVPCALMFYDLVVPISKLFQILLYLDDVRFSMLSSVGEDGAIGLT